MKTLLTLRREGLTDTAGLVLGFFGNRPKAGQVDFMSFIRSACPKAPINQDRVSIVCKHLEAKGLLACEPEAGGKRNVEGRPKKRYQLTAAGQDIFNQFDK